METKKMSLMRFFEESIESTEGKSITVFIKMPNLTALEEITNPRENWEIKKAYYINAYDSLLCLINNPSIQIVDWKLNI